VDVVLRGLDESQRAAVTSDAAPLAILAGAGSGKTRVLTRRIAWRVGQGREEAARVLAVTFTRKAAGELRARLGRLGVAGPVTAGTFHAVALDQLRRRAAELGTRAPVVLDRKARLLTPLAGARGRDAALAARELAGEIEWAKARLVTPDDYPRALAVAGRTPPRPADEVADVYRRYEREKRRRGVVDFDDLILECARELGRDPEFAAAQRWRFRHLYVDEFQDASPAQLRLLRGWLGDRSDLCVVGDPDQAIYGFAGADASHLARFTAHFPPERHPDVGVVRLEGNYRSTPEIVTAAQAVLSGGRRRARTVHTTRPAGAVPRVTVFDTDADEARGVAAAVRAAQGPERPWRRMAVLYRVNAQSAAFEEAFTRAGVPFRVRGGERFLDRPEVRQALDALRTIEQDAARHGVRRTFGEHLADLAEDAAGWAEERREHVDALVALGHEYLAAGHDRGGGTGGDVDGFVAYLATTFRGDDGDGVGGDAVELMTFHRAKGLEFDQVWVTGLERGLVPISYAKTTEALDEEQRLLYVALSRAESVLHLSWARQRTAGGRTTSRTPSPWVARVEQAGRGGDGGTADVEPADARARIAAARERVARGAGAGRGRRGVAEITEEDAPLYGALVEWRRRQARAADTPAYVIFHDATLAAIASARPRSAPELLAVAGIGPVKAERYGEAVLALVAEHTG